MKMQATITPKHGDTVEELLVALSTVPPSATYSIQSHSGDRNYMDWYTITFSWDTDKT